MLEILAKYGVKLSEGNKDKVSVTVWGTGEPLREFMYSLDMAEACVFVMEDIDIKDITALGEYDLRSDQYPPHFINIGTGEEITIRDLAFKIKDLTGFRGDIVFDTSKPDGTMRKATDATRLRQLGYQHKFDLNAGLAAMYDHYKS